MKNNLFDNNSLNSYIEKYSKSFNSIEYKLKTVKDWIQNLEAGYLKDEKSNHGNFEKFILINLLDYVKDVNPDKTDIIYEKSTEGNESADFVLLKNNKPYIAIELKGSEWDLDKDTNHKNETCMQQASRYANSKKSFKYCIVCNYDEFRLFSKDSREEYISYKFNELTNPIRLKEFLLLFSKDGLIENNVLNQLIENTVVIQKQIKDFEDGFYNLYSETRLMLIKELQLINDDKKGLNKSDSIRYAQLILNRYIFICFAEDKGLLPSDISIHTLTKALSDIYETELWHSLTRLFRFINDGNHKNNINEFNGGLFHEKLENLFDIRDTVPSGFFNDCKKKYNFTEQESNANELLKDYTEDINPIFKNLLILSSFDFDSEVDVNILGHIFENSIGDIEKLKGQINSKRRTEGVFYTPPYITEYICCNTIIPYLSKSGEVNTIDDLISEYNLGKSELMDLDNKLKNIKIIDPACGSGAFLNKACDVLLEIHEKLWELLYKDDKSLDKYFDNNSVRRRILIDNLFGVDLNEESVEITKLGMFLKVAQKDSKLPILDKNIKCGNSLINDTGIVGDKAFNWENEFSDIFEEGGFDIVIGNPPYVRQERIKELKPYLKKNYECYNGIADLYVYFFEKALYILKKGGCFSYICSSKYTKAKYGKELRKLLLTNKITKYLDLSENQDIFEDATTYPSIINVKKDNPSDDFKITINDNYEILQKRLTSNPWTFKNPQILDLKNKIKLNTIELSKIEGIKIRRGITTGSNDVFVINEKIKDKLIEEDSSNKDIIKPILKGKNIKKEGITYQNLYLLYIPWEFEIEKHSSLKEYFIKFKEELSNRPEVEDNKYNWYCLSRYASDYYEEFERPKLIYPQMSKNLLSVYDENGFYLLNSAFMINYYKNDKTYLKSLASIISSNVLDFYIKLTADFMRGSTLSLKKVYMDKLPICNINILKQKKLAKLNDIIQYNYELYNKEINNFKKWLCRTFEIENLSNKLKNYYDLNFEEFFEELKNKVDAKTREDIETRKKQELLKKEFEYSLDKIEYLQQSIEEAEQELNQLVYELYDLTNEEISIIEEETSEMN